MCVKKEPGISPACYTFLTFFLSQSHYCTFWAAFNTPCKQEKIENKSKFSKKCIKNIRVKKVKNLC